MKDSAGQQDTPKKRLAIIGTGPVSMLKALFLSKAHPTYEIMLFDTAPIVGGAWYAERSPDGHPIECGCHIWSYVPIAYNFIEKELGVKLFPLKPHPIFVRNGLRVPYDIKNTLHTYKTLAKTTLSLRWHKLKNLKDDPNVNFRIIGKRNKYPKTGSPELVKAILERIEKNPKIHFNLNTEILHLNLDSDVRLVTKSTTYEFDHLFATYVSRLGVVKIQGHEIKTNTTRVDYIHFLLELNKPLLKKLNYWRLINDNIIHRITDISYQTNYEENLVLVGIKDTAYYKYDEAFLLNHVEQLFFKYKLIDKTFSVKKIRTHIFPTNYLSQDTITELKAKSEKITFMATTDLMNGIYFLLREEGAI